MPPRVHKVIIWVGFFLLAIVLGCLLLLAVIFTLEGSGGLGVSYNRAGWPTSMIPVAYLPVFIIGLGVVAVWLVTLIGRGIKRFFDRRSGRPQQ